MTGSRSRGRRRLAIALIVVASLLTFLAVFALWANRQLLNTDNWAETSSELLEDDAIRTQVSTFIVDELYANVDVQSELEQVFEQVLAPARAQVLAGPAAGGLRSLAEDGVDRLLQRPVPQRLWEEANRRAQARFLQIVEGGGDNLSTSGGVVTLDLKSLLGQSQSNLGVGGRVQQKLPDSASQIVLLRSDQLKAAQDAVWLLKTLAIVFVVLALVLFALAVYLARGWRREALRAAGLGLLFAGAGALVARALVGDAVVNALAIDRGRAAGGGIGLEHRHLAAGPGGHGHDHLRRGARDGGLAGRPVQMGRGRPAQPRALAAGAALGLGSLRRRRARPDRLGPHSRFPPGDPRARPDRAARARPRGAPPPDGARVPRRAPRGFVHRPPRLGPRAYRSPAWALRPMIGWSSSSGWAGCVTAAC